MDEVLPKAMLKIVGTSHVAQESAQAIRTAYEEFKPDTIAIELDKRRLQALHQRKAGEKHERPPLSMVREVGLTGYLFILIASSLQKKVGDILKVEPGVDMLAGVELAAQHNLKLALV